MFILVDKCAQTKMCTRWSYLDIKCVLTFGQTKDKTYAF